MMKDKPLITTIIPTYRRPQMLRCAVNSVLKQTYPKFQICVYDNASGDETAEVMKELCHQDLRVHYHCHSKNIGMMANYEYGLARVNTPFFSILSDDDYLMPYFFETAINAFEEYPHAAFAACSVLAVTTKGIVVSEPLSNWQRGGYFHASEGAIEMIKSKAKLPIPTGILFQSRLVKEISPDFSQEMQLMWDPDYLLQIAACFPILIIKKVCGLFVVHEDGFSSGFYKEVFEDPKHLEIYFKTIEKMIKRLRENSFLSLDVRNRIIDALVAMVRTEMIHYIKQFMRLKKIKGAYYSAKLFQRYYGSDKYMWFLLAPTAAYIYLPFVRPLMRVALKVAKKVRNSKIVLEDHSAKYQEYHEVIQKFVTK